MEYKKPKTKAENKAIKSIIKKPAKLKKGSPDAIFKAFDELHKAGFSLKQLEA